MNRIIEASLALSLLFLVFSCSDDEGSKTDPSVNVRDTTFAVDENPMDGALIGKLNASTAIMPQSEQLKYTLINQSIEGAIVLNETTGEFAVADSSVFNFEVNANITATVDVTAADMSKTATVKININNLPDEWVQVGTDILGEAAGDQFGRGISINKDGTVMAVGAPRNKENASYAGHVRAYSRGTLDGAWTQLGDDIDGGSGDMSGLAVSINDSGERILIGSYQGSSNYYPGFASARGGHARVFSLEGESWSKLGITLGGYKLSPDGTINDTNFGQAVSISGTGERIAVGAPSVYNGNNSRGYTVAFEASETNGWKQLGNRKEGGSVNERTGYAVSLNEDGTIQAVGSPESSARKGHVNVYELIGEEWTSIGSSIIGDEALDRLGIGISLSDDGQILAIGADASGQSDKPGYFKVYRNESGEWVQLGSTIYGRDDADRMGQGISINGDGSTLVVGGFDSNQNGDHSGYVRVYKYDEVKKDWMQIGPDFEGKAGDRFGVAVSINNQGNAIIIGADQYHNESQPGYVRTYWLR
ncbi:hypothetical protein [Fulvivirga sediminis]|uniref:Cadherin domain-containing protein n=1 Tax=Fulvivirga sediminis TaxID=2803949 RepID=A0A937JY00_9BACT|nr:hypothetical protein [Fulvivirga sediminis]MBL3655164.1 hypothetical protein [Fulvivirga sediminis]